MSQSREVFMGVSVMASMLCEFADAHSIVDVGDKKVLDAGDYPLAQDDPPDDDRMRQEIDALHVYVAQSMRALDDVLKSLSNLVTSEVRAKASEQAECGISEYQPQVTGSDDLLNLSHVRIDAYRLAKQAKRLAFLYSRVGYPDESA
jgi:hypothetical protein